MTCECEKALYPSYGAAIASALRAMRKSGDSLRVYKCPNDRGFHLTKKALQ